MARLELSNLFYSPIAWLLLIVFAVQSGLQIIDLLEIIVRYQTYGWQKLNLTEKLFNGRLLMIRDYLYLYIPLLTMGLISKELSSGSIKLLLSSPLTSFEIVIGKYLSMMIYGLLMIFVLVLFGIACICSITSLDISLMVSGLIGIYLLFCIYAAIGLFMSCLSQYQAVAAIGALFMMALLNYIGEIGEKAGLPSQLRYYLNIKGHSDQFISGLVSTKNLFYYGFVVILFLTLTVLILTGKKSQEGVYLKAGKGAAFIFSCILMIYITSMPAWTGYIDMTANKTQTVTINTQRILKRFDSAIKIHTYINTVGPYADLGMPEKISEDKALFEKYRRFLPGLTIDYTYYYDSAEAMNYWYNQFPGLTVRQIAIKTARISGLDFGRVISSEDLRKKIDLRSEQNQFVRQLQYGDKTAFLRVFDLSFSNGEWSFQPSEDEVASALKRLLVKPPKIIFLTGNGERGIYQKGDQGYYHAATQVDSRGSLINRGFDVEDLDLNSRDIPEDIAALVIGDPMLSFSVAGLEKLSHYINSGGNLLIAGEPGRQSILNPLLKQLGIEMQDGQLFRPQNGDGPDFIMAGFTENAYDVSPCFRDFAKSGDSIVLPGAAALTYRENGQYRVRPLLATGGYTWNRLRPIIGDKGSIPFEPIMGDIKKNWPVALALTKHIKGREQRIMVLGDADFLTESEMERNSEGATQTRDLVFAAEIFKWFTYGSFPVDAGHRDTQHTYRIGLKGLFVIRLLFLIVLPSLLFISGTILLIIRKRK